MPAEAEPGADVVRGSNGMPGCQVAARTDGHEKNPVLIIIPALAALHRTYLRFDRRLCHSPRREKEVNITDIGVCIGSLFADQCHRLCWVMHASNSDGRMPTNARARPI